MKNRSVLICGRILGSIRDKTEDGGSTPAVHHAVGEEPPTRLSSILGAIFIFLEFTC